MALKKVEKQLLEALDSMLQADAELGLKHHKKDHEKMGKSERGFEYLHNHIDELFQVRAAELDHSDSVCRAFKKVHNYKYIDDTTFRDAMEKEMTAEGVPAEVRAKSHKIVEKILKEQGDSKDWNEKDSGFVDLQDIKDVSQPEQDTDLEIL